MSETDSTSEQSEVKSESPVSPSSSQGDGRKQLPSIPIPQISTMSAAGHPSNRKGSTSPGANGYGPFFQEYSLMSEYALLHKQKLPGVYVLPSAKSPLVWNGVLFIRQGIYQEGVFRFTMTIPENYPDGDCPNFRFEFPVFHPMVNPESGEIEVKRAFPKWRKNVHHLGQVLLYARRIFYKIETNLPLNPEAAVLYDQEPEIFKNRVTETIRSAKEQAFQPPALDDPFAVRFTPWDPAIHEDTKRQMLHAKRGQSEERSSTSSSVGLSWMKSGSTQIFSREDSASA